MVFRLSLEERLKDLTFDLSPGPALIVKVGLVFKVTEVVFELRLVSSLM
jgi:hypothetical protein